MILLIDNYDSFVHNLARYFQNAGPETRVIRNDQISIAEIEDLAPEAIILSPGPCTPPSAGISIDIVRRLGQRFPVMGVCLGHQAIGEAMGLKTLRGPAPVHGEASAVYHNGNGLFEGLPSPLQGGRYHSLIMSEPSIGDMLEVTARDENGIIMAVQHRADPVYGIQFHPESILTEHGPALIDNFLKTASRFNRRKVAA